MSIDFKATKGIFQQIADNLCHQILGGKLFPGERIPSVRDLAEEFEVNRNTILRTYSILDDAGIISNKRGIGYFVSDNAKDLIKQQERQDFFENQLPDFIQKVKLLELTAKDLSVLISTIKNNTNEEK